MSVFSGDSKATLIHPSSVRNWMQQNWFKADSESIKMVVQRIKLSQLSNIFVWAGPNGNGEWAKPQLQAQGCFAGRGQSWQTNLLPISLPVLRLWALIPTCNKPGSVCIPIPTLAAEAKTPLPTHILEWAMRSAVPSVRCQVNYTLKAQMIPSKSSPPWITSCFFKVKPLCSDTGWVSSEPGAWTSLLRQGGSARHGTEQTRPVEDNRGSLCRW